MGRRARAVLVAGFIGLGLLAGAAAASADTLRGRVTGPDYLPVVGAHVMIFRGFKLEATLITNDTGRYGPQTLAPGMYEVMVAARGLATEPRTVTIGAGTADIELDVAMTAVAASEYVVVTAPPLGVEGLGNVIRHRTVFDRSDIVSLQAESLADVLRLVPGLQLHSWGGAGAAASLTAWGGNPGDVVVLVDGVPQNFFGGTFDASHISAADIDHIDVLRGADSVVENVRSSSAIVHVTTLSQTPARFNVTAEGGLEPSGRLTAAAGRAGQEWTWSGSGEWLGTRGENGRATPSGATVANDDYTRAVGSASLQWQDQPGRFARLQGRVTDTSRGYPGPWGTDRLGLNPGIDTISRGHGRNESVVFSALAPTAAALTHRMDVSLSHWRSGFTNPSYAQDISTRRLLFHYHIDADMTRTTLVTGGVEREWETATDSLVRDTANTPLTLSRSFTSYFGEIRQSFGTRVFLSSGARVDVVERAALDGNSTPSAFRPALAKTSRAQGNARGSATAVLYRDRRGNVLTLRANGGTSTKPATAEEIGFSENPALRPEHSRMASGGLEAVMARGRLTLNADVFQYRFEDLIVPVVLQRDGVLRIVTDNIAVARARGATASTSIRFPGHVLAQGNITWLDTRVLEARCACSDTLPLLPIGDDTALVRRPKLAGSASLIWTHDAHSAFVTVGGRGPMRDLEPAFGRQIFDNPGFVSVSAGLSIPVARPGVQIFARVSNLFDRSYEEILGYPAPRRALTFGLRLASRP